LTAINPWKFSSCSTSLFNSFIDSLTRKVSNEFGLVAVNSLETYLVRLSIKLLKELVEHDENFHGLVAVNSLEIHVVRLSIKY
jgi:hypothetical protein